MTNVLLIAALFSFAACGRAPRKPEIHYTLSGKGDVTLLFVHGWCIDGSYWDAQVNYFSDSFQTLAVDLRGHGKSPGAGDTMTMEVYAQDIVNLVNYLELDRVILIGHSMAGNINLHVYESIPEKIVGFIGIDNLQEVGKIRTKEEEAEIAGFFAGLKQDYAGVAEQFSRAALFHEKTDSLVKQRVISSVIDANPTTAISTLESLVRENVSEQRILPKLRIPLLLIVAENSIKSENSLKQYCPNGYQYREIADCGHYPMIERPEAFNRLLKETITQALASGQIRR